MRAVAGTPPAECQEGLSPTQKLQGYFLACSCKPKSDLTIALLDDNARNKMRARVIDKTPLSPKIMRLRLQPENTFNYHPGQFLNLHRPDGLIRSYSIASIPGEPFLELHIERIDNGKMSSWIHDELTVDTEVEIDGANGNCFYLEGNPEQPLLLIGTGSGLAPLWGILRHALTQKHRAAIHLFHGSHDLTKLYLAEELRSLTNNYPQFHYTPCLSGSEQQGYAHGRANELALAQIGSLKGWRVFLCGHPEMVKSTQMGAFLAGASMQDIYSDPFTISAT
jgi:NAD(P)H-flavin reductase